MTSGAKRRALAVAIGCVGAAGVVCGEWLETQPNPLLDGWRMFGGGAGGAHRQQFSLSDLLVYAPLYLPALGVLFPPFPGVRGSIGVVAALGGVLGALGLAAFPLLFGYGLRPGIFPFLVLQAALWLAWMKAHQRPDPMPNTG